MDGQETRIESTINSWAGNKVSDSGLSPQHLAIEESRGYGLPRFVVRCLPPTITVSSNVGWPWWVDFRNVSRNYR